MKKYFTFLICFLIPATIFAKQDIGSLLNELDQTVEHCEIYSIQKEKKIRELKGQLKKCTSDSLKYVICSRLYDEYKSYKSDSALKYAREELNIAEKTQELRQLNDSRLDLAFILSITGMYKESLDILQRVDKNAVQELKARYFDVSNSIYGYMNDYAVNQEKSKYDEQIEAYRDSLLLLNAPTSSEYAMGKAHQLIGKKQYNAALSILLRFYPNLRKDIRRKANFAFIISYVYQLKGEYKKEKYWLIVSAINDLQSANKEYISLRSLAYLLYEEGDIDRAYKYIRQSAEDALFCNARLRTFEVSQMLPIIDKAYQAQTEARQRQLIVFLVSISLLSLFLLIALIFIYRQMRTLSIARKNLSLANDKLKQLNDQLLVANFQLQETNQTLNESNLIKEEYIGRYMDQCSIYIDKMDNYRRMLNKKATGGNIEDLLKTIKSKQVIDEELKEFYNRFDSTFLQLFPTFVRDFSALLEDDEFVQLKPGQLLNTELRIYALMRLGITNGEKMSQFLRCSLSTIYNYRTKVRNKAIGSREKFEENILKIGKELE